MEAGEGEEDFEIFVHEGHKFSRRGNAWAGRPWHEMMALRYSVPQALACGCIVLWQLQDSLDRHGPYPSGAVSPIPRDHGDGGSKPTADQFIPLVCPEEHIATIGQPNDGLQRACFD